MKRGRRSIHEEEHDANEVQPPAREPDGVGRAKAAPDEQDAFREQPARDAEPLYVISVAAKLTRMPAWTLRVLDEQGIVVPKRTDKNRRLYSDRDLGRLARVRTLTEEMGINMNGVRLILQLEEERDKGDRSR